MLLVKIETPLWQRSQINEEENKAGLRCTSGLVDETKDVFHVHEFDTKQRASKIYNSKVFQKRCKKAI